MARSRAVIFVGFAALLVVALVLWPPTQGRSLTGDGAGVGDVRSFAEGAAETREPLAERLLAPTSAAPAAEASEASSPGIVIQDASGASVAGLPVLALDQRVRTRLEGTWAPLFEGAHATDAAGRWRPRPDEVQRPNEVAVLVLPHAILLASVEDGVPLRLPAMQTLTVVPCGLQPAQNWSCWVRPPYGERAFAEVPIHARARLLLREFEVGGATEQVVVAAGPAATEWSLHAASSTFAVRLSSTVVRVPAIVELHGDADTGRVTLVVHDEHGQALSLPGTVRVAHSERGAAAAMALERGALVFPAGFFERDAAYRLDVILQGGRSLGPYDYRFPQHGPRIVATVDAATPNAITVEVPQPMTVAAVLVETAAGFREVRRIDRSSFGDEWFRQDAAAALSVFVDPREKGVAVAWIVAERGSVATVRSLGDHPAARAVVEPAEPCVVGPALFGRTAWPAGLVAVEMEFVGVLSGQRHVHPLAAARTQDLAGAIGPFERTTGTHVELHAVLKPSGQRRERVPVPRPR